jgi:hypothetical protein
MRCRHVSVPLPKGFCAHERYRYRHCDHISGPITGHRTASFATRRTPNRKPDHLAPGSAVGRTPSRITIPIADHLAAWTAICRVPDPPTGSRLHPR